MLGFPAGPMSQIALGLLLHVRFEPPRGDRSPEHRLPSWSPARILNIGSAIISRAQA